MSRRDLIRARIRVSQLSNYVGHQRRRLLLNYPLEREWLFDAMGAAVDEGWRAYLSDNYPRMINAIRALEGAAAPKGSV